MGGRPCLYLQPDGSWSPPRLQLSFHSPTSSTKWAWQCCQSLPGVWGYPEAARSGRCRQGCLGQSWAHGAPVSQAWSQGSACRGSPLGKAPIARQERRAGVCCVGFSLLAPGPSSAFLDCRGGKAKPRIQDSQTQLGFTYQKGSEKPGSRAERSRVQGRQGTGQVGPGGHPAHSPGSHSWKVSLLKGSGSHTLAYISQTHPVGALIGNKAMTRQGQMALPETFTWGPPRSCQGKGPGVEQAGCVCAQGGGAATASWGDPLDSRPVAGLFRHSEPRWPLGKVCVQRLWCLARPRPLVNVW